MRTLQKPLRYSRSGEKMKLERLTIVAPVFNEGAGIARFHERTRAVLDTIHGVQTTILFVVDKSTDNSLDVLREVARTDEHVRILALSARFGHQMSLLAGIEHSSDADAVIMMDSDLQHPPELIPKLIAAYKDGADVVYTVRQDTKDVRMIRKVAGNLFYWMLRKVSHVPINANAADFRLISARVVHLLSTQFHERNMFLRGLFSWIGFPQTSIEYVAEKRNYGDSKYTFSRTLRLASAGVLSFSTKPLQLGVFLGAAVACLAFVLLLASLLSYFIDRSVPSGWTTLVAISLLFSGVQLIIIGIIGMYIGDIYEEVKRRPRYIVEEEISQNGK
jgi:polyisoprenyl-phosphate glycosyltransferase